MTCIFTFHPLISCLDAVNYLDNRRHQFILQTEPRTGYSQIRVSGLSDLDVAAVVQNLISQFPGVPSEFRDGQMLRLDVEHGD